MRKVIDNNTVTSVLRRIDKLTPYAQPRWGSLSVKGMMFHYVTVTNEILAAPPNEGKPTTKETITRTVGLYLMKNFPKGIKSGNQYIADKNEYLIFTREMERLKDTVQLIATYNKPIHGKHPFMGPLNNQEWRIFLYKHLDHHLRQFGV